MPGVPLIVGPVTLAPPYNPNATGPEPETPEDELPPQVDHRQLSLLGAGWTLGSIHRLAAAGADGLTYYELYGWRGLQRAPARPLPASPLPLEPGQLFPLYHVFAVASDFTGGSLAAAEIATPSRSKPSPWSKTIRPASSSPASPRSRSTSRSTSPVSPTPPSATSTNRPTPMPRATLVPPQRQGSPFNRRKQRHHPPLPVRYCVHQWGSSVTPG